MPVTTIQSVADDFLGGPAFLRRLFQRLFAFDRLEQLYQSLLSGSAEEPLPARLLKSLAVRYRISDRDLQHFPVQGATVVVANHPFGVLEGAVLTTLFGKIRPDVRILANRFLGILPELRNLVIPVDTMPAKGTGQRNAAALRSAAEFLSNGGCLIVFPAGEVSHMDWISTDVCDSQWNTAVVRLVASVSRRGTPVSVVPAFIRGTNSMLFQLLGLIHPHLRTAMLVRELLNKRNTCVEIRASSAIPDRKLLEMTGPLEQTEYLRWRTYLLAERPDYSTNTTRPVSREKNRRQAPAIEAVAPELLAQEVALLPAESRMIETGGLEVYLTSAPRIPLVLREIGRLREVTFRAVGEGTGKSLDLDRFDQSYLHLFAWNPKTREVVGAYRLAGTDSTAELYTATLFHYEDEFKTRLGPALELGRSFIRREYQKGFAPLLALWRGIGTYIGRNPRYRVLFGPVSISNQYQSISRELMVSYLERYASLREWMNLISVRHPFRPRRPASGVPAAAFDLDDLSACISDVEPGRAGVPVLLRQYLKLGGKLVGFNVDPRFSNALDGLIMVDLLKTEPRLLDRYFGKDEAASFLAFQKGQSCTAKHS